MEKLVLVSFEKYQRLLEHSKAKPSHQERIPPTQPPPGKRDTSPERRIKGQSADDSGSLSKKQTGKLKKEESKIRWISF